MRHQLLVVSLSVGFALTGCHHGTPRPASLVPQVQADRTDAEATAPIANNGLLVGLRNRNFDAIDEQLTGYQKDFENDVTQEEQVRRAFATFARIDPNDGVLLEEWTQAAPQSFAAHLARADYLFRQGWETRGGASGAQVPEAHMQTMDEFFDQGANEVTAALKINPKLTVGYALVIRAAKTRYDLDVVNDIATTGLKQEPYSLAIRAAFIEALLPRWGGSSAAMDQYARESQKYVKQNPELRLLLGHSDGTKVPPISRVIPTWHWATSIARLKKAVTIGGSTQVVARRTTGSKITMAR